MSALVLILALGLVLFLASLPGVWSWILPTLVAVGLYWQFADQPDLGLTVLCGFLFTALLGYVWRHCFFIITI